MPRSIPLSKVDTAWYQMEDPTNLMMVTSIVLLQEKLDVERFRQTIQQRIIEPFPRFRSRVVESILPLRNPHWELDAHFSLKAHIRHVALPAPGDQSVLQDFVSDLMSTPLDFSKPPWQIHILDNYRDATAVLFRIHHCIADGIALVRVLLNTTDTSPQAPIEQPGEERPKTRQAKASPLPAVLKPATDALKLGQKITETVYHESTEALFNPLEALEKGKSAAWLAAKGAAATGKLLLMPADPPTPFKGRLGPHKRAAWSRPVSLADVKKIGRVTGSKVNDVLLAAMTGALRRYLIQRGTDVAHLNFRAAVPVNLRPLDGPIELGNQFGLVFLSLPVGIEDAFDRLVELKRRMGAIKGSPEAIIALGILGILGSSPSQFADQFITVMGTKATAVATNVPGPRETIYMAGSAIDNIMFWVPQSGRLGLGISIFSYDGKVTLGVATDEGLVPDPEKILQGFYAEFEALLQLVRQVET